MASPQKENGYTAIANELFDKLVKTPLLGAELQVCLYVIRKTYGFNKTEDAISITQFERDTGKSRPTIVKALKNLQLVNILQLVKVGNSKNSSNIYKLNKDYDKWNLVKTPKLVKYNNSTSKVNANKLVKTPKHTKDKLQKTIQKTIVPKWISEEWWDAFIESRKKLHRPMTEKAKELIIQKLEKLKTQGNSPDEVLKQSVECSYQGVFPLKGETHGKQKGFNTGQRSGGRFIRTEREAINDDACDEAEQIAREYRAKQVSADGGGSKKP